MLNRQSFQFTVAICLVLLIFDVVQARFMRPDLEKVPITQLVESLKKKIEQSPEDSKLQLNLARAYAMAYASKGNEVQIEKRKPNQVWFGYTPSHIPFGEVKETDDMGKSEEAKQNLNLAIEHYKKVLELDKNNLTAQIGLAWAQEQAGHTERAIAGYRETIETGWEKEKDMTSAGLNWHSVVVEAAGYLKQHLDEEADADEIADLNRKIEKLQKVVRPITPIAIPLSADLQLQDIVDASARVAFDADGSGTQKEWTWIQPNAGWLAYDQTGSKKIDSAIQMFGSVTFMCFWDNGYEALATLDRDSNGWLENEELNHLVIWHDANCNGVSDAGEVRPVSEYEIEAISCRSVEMQNSQAVYSPNGVRFSDQSYRSSYDVVISQK